MAIVKLLAQNLISATNEVSTVKLNLKIGTLKVQNKTLIFE